jgi:hypothetical protein
MVDFWFFQVLGEKFLWGRPQGAGELGGRGMPTLVDQDGELQGRVFAVFPPKDL